MSSILPRVNAGYKRVDVEDGRAGRMRFGWKKFAIVAGLVVGLVWLFGPRERRESVIDTIKTPTWGKPTRPPEIHEDLDDDLSLPAKPPLVKVSSPHSPEEDPDPLKTVHCTSPANPSARLVQYALMIDAGSTGSRIHIYKFNNCGASPAYEYEVFKQTHPGLSAYKGDALGAAEKLDVLLDEAVAVVPKELWSCTPVAVKATAGLRLLGAEQSKDILDAVRHHLLEKYPFALVEKDGVVIMDGKDEGVFAWITANYLLGTIGGSDASSSSSSAEHSYAVLDLGGGSTQIVFEPDFDDDSHFVDGEHKYELTFGGKKHTLYQHSYLGYGLMSARRSIHRLVEFMATFSHISLPEGDEEIPNPCLYKGSKRVVELEPSRTGEDVRNVTMAGKDIGSFEACNRMVELVMAKDAICQTKPCSFNGVYQPSILETFAEGNVLLLSYFYDRLAPFFPSPVPSSSSSLSPSSSKLRVDTVASLARDICAGPNPRSTSSSQLGWDNLPALKDDPSLLEELEGRPEYCLDLTFMHALLRLGYEFPAERGVRVEKQIEGTELGWCLGAAMTMVGAELKCRV
ncbi:GDA1 [Sanghuangporus sanghuang]